MSSLIGPSLQSTGRALRKGWIARIVEGDLVSRYYFQFNPTEKNTEKNVNYTFVSPPGSPLPTAVFGNVEGDVITMTHFLDATSNYSDARMGTLAQQAALESYLQPDIDRYINSIGQFVAPPQVILGYGGKALKVVITGMNFRDVRFNNNLIPTRTYVDMTMTAIFSSFEDYRARLQQLAALRTLVTVQEIY